MSIKRLSRFLGTTLLAAAATFGVVGKAGAAVFVGDWDPDVGGSFASTYGSQYWTGQVTFFIDDTCLANNTAAVSSGSCPMNVQSASVSFFTSDPNVSGTLIETVNFASPGSLTGAYIYGSTPHKVGTFYGYSGPATYVNEGNLQIYLVYDAASVGDTIFQGAFLSTDVACDQDRPEYRCYVPSGAFSEKAQATRFSQVPEPGTLALIGLGLVGLAYKRRRMQ